MAGTASKSIPNWRRCPSNCYNNDENMRLWIWRSAVAPSDAAEKLQYRCTTTVPHVDNRPHNLENLSLCNFWCAQFYSFPTIFDYSCELCQLLPALATCGKIYRCTSTFSALNYMRWNFIKISLLSIWSGAHNFSADFWSYRNLRTQIGKIVAPSVVETGNL